MVKPAGVDAGVGQWLEIQNETEEPVNLQGMVIATLSGGFHVISPAQAMILGPGGALILSRAGDPEVNGGVDPDYTYGGELLMDQAEDVLFLLKGGALVDLVAYGPESLDVKTGAAFSLEPPPPGSQVVKQWCYGRELFGPFGNLGTPGQPNTFCDGDADGVAEDQGDCDDGNPAMHPEAVEGCNGLDDDCNGIVDDGLVVPLECLESGVCKGSMATCAGTDGFACPYPDTYENVETSCDGLDNDCDGWTDEDLPLVGQCRQDGVCEGSHLECGGVEGFLCSYPGTFQAEEASCDGLDNDCDGETDEGFDTGNVCVSGIGSCGVQGQWECAPDGSGSVCNATAGEPSAELCGDGLDNDCDGETDEGFQVSGNCWVGVGSCAVIGKYRCSEDGTDVTCQAIPGKPDAEKCGDGIDNDCDGVVDEEDCSGPGSGGGGCSVSRHHRGHGSMGLLAGVLIFALVLSGRRPGRFVRV